MARPRFTGQGFTNPLDSLGFNAESRHRAKPPISNAFMSNEAFFAENPQGNQEFQAIPGFNRLVGKSITKQFGKGSAKKAGGRSLFQRLTGRGARREVVGEGAGEVSEATIRREIAEEAIILQAKTPFRATMVRWGSFTVIGLAGVVGALGLGGDFVDDLIGANCPDDAKAQGLAEGTPEYQKAVEDCQGKAANTIAMIGIAGVAVIGLVLFAVLRPKKSE